MNAGRSARAAWPSRRRRRARRCSSRRAQVGPRPLGRLISSRQLRLSPPNTSPHPPSTPPSRPLLNIVGRETLRGGCARASCIMLRPSPPPPPPPFHPPTPPLPPQVVKRSEVDTTAPQGAIHYHEQWAGEGRWLSPLHRRDACPALLLEVVRALQDAWPPDAWARGPAISIACVARANHPSPGHAGKMT